MIPRTNINRLAELDLNPITETGGSNVKDKLFIFFVRLFDREYASVTGNPVDDMQRDYQILQRVQAAKPYLIALGILAVSGTSYYIYTRKK